MRLRLHSTAFFSGFLSFALPGLGQLYLKRPLISVPLFCLFIFLLSNRSLQIYVPFYNLLAALLSFSTTPLENVDSIVRYSGRAALFSIIAGIAWIGWFWIVGQRFVPLP